MARLQGGTGANVKGSCRKCGGGTYKIILKYFKDYYYIYRINNNN